MTQEILNMSKEELVSKIVEADKLGKDFEKTLKEMMKARDELLIRADSITKDIERGIDTMKLLAVTKTEMELLLAEKYGSMVI